MSISASERTEQPDPDRQNPNTVEPQAVDPALFAQHEVPKHRRYAAAVGVGVFTVGGAFMASKFGFDKDLLDTAIVPQPRAIPEIVDGFVVVNEMLRTAAPVVAAGALATGAYFKLEEKMGSKFAMIGRLSRKEYSGADDIVTPSQNSNSLVSRWKSKVARGTGLTALAVALTGATSGVEHEISNGPQRPIDAMYQTITPGATSRSMILQSPNNTFMDDSDIKKPKMDAFVAYAKEKGVEVVPFDKKLFNIEGRSALQVSVPDDTYRVMTQKTGEFACKDASIIVDTTVDKNVGEKVSVNGRYLTVAGKEKGIAQMNRSIGIMSDRATRECIQSETDESYFGALIPDTDPEKLTELIKESQAFDGEALAVVPQEHFEEANRKFWRANGTPILLQLIAYIGMFGAAAAAAQRVGSLQRNVREIGIMNASGVSMNTIQKVENRRALRETMTATVLAAPFMPVVAGVFNMAEIGLKVGVGVRELAVGFVVGLGANMWGARRAVKKFSKGLDTSQAVKG